MSDTINPDEWRTGSIKQTYPAIELQTTPPNLIPVIQALVKGDTPLMLRHNGSLKQLSTCELSLYNIHLLLAIGCKLAIYKSADTVFMVKSMSDFVEAY